MGQLEHIFTSQTCTNINQSFRLQELGLKIETTDMKLVLAFSFIGGRKTHFHVGCSSVLADNLGLEGLPAWSFDRLKEICTIRCASRSFDLANTTYDSLIDCIEKDIKENIFPREYLK